MKTWMITLPLLCMASVAMADDVQKDQAAAPTQAISVRHKAPHGVHKRMMKRLRPVNLPRGDLRYCLERKTDEEIIRCAEERRKR